MPSPSWRIAFRDWFGLSRSTADVLALLYEAQGKPIPAAEIARSAGVAQGAVSFHIYRLRASLEGCIETVGFGPQKGRSGCAPAEGYALDAEALAECRAVLHALAEELARAP